MNKETLASIRYCFQTILVPCAVFIGVLGNSVSVLVLTRKRMRSSTNIYLTALAIADIIYLMMVFSLSFQHYKNIHHPRYELYWRTYGLQYWFCDAASYTSIYITVSFTVERYIAVCHPIRGQVLCTESKAKKVISVVVIMCLLCTCTTPFEYVLSYSPEYVDMKTYQPCTPPGVNSSDGIHIPAPNCTLPWTTTTKVPAAGMGPPNRTQPSEHHHMPAESRMNASTTALLEALTTSSVPTILSSSSSSRPTVGNVLYDLTSSTTKSDNYYQEYSDYDYKDYVADSPILSNHQRNGEVDVETTPTTLEGVNMENMIMTFASTTLQTMRPEHSTDAGNHTRTTTNEASTTVSLSKSASSSSSPASITSPPDNCRCIYYLEVKSSPLGENETYLLVFMWTTSLVFTFIPLILLITFNSLLVLAVKESNKLRDKMTNINSRKVKSKISSISQENKITVTLIAVVILFIICQTPTAVFIVINASIPHELPEDTDNMRRAFGNIFNFLITFNAASNFLLYCALSEKYRQTVRELIMGRKHMRQATLKSFYLSRHGTMNESLYSNHFNSRRQKPPPLPPIPADHSSAAASTVEIPESRQMSRHPSNRSERSSIIRHNQGRNSFHNEPIPEHRASDPVASNLPRKHSCFPEAEGNGAEVIPFNRPIETTGSLSSLTRSQSVILEPKVRHSPGCKKYNNL